MDGKREEGMQGELFPPFSLQYLTTGRVTMSFAALLPAAAESAGESDGWCATIETANGTLGDSRLRQKSCNESCSYICRNRSK